MYGCTAFLQLYFFGSGLYCSKRPRSHLVCSAGSRATRTRFADSYGWGNREQFIQPSFLFLALICISSPLYYPWYIHHINISKKKELPSLEAEGRGGFGDERYEVSEFQLKVKEQVINMKLKLTQPIFKQLFKIWKR